jgi:hypothetical protein
VPSPELQTPAIRTDRREGEAAAAINALASKKTRRFSHSGLHQQPPKPGGGLLVDLDHLQEGVDFLLIEVAERVPLPASLHGRNLDPLSRA